MRVLTLSDAEFENHCHRLEEMAASFHPELIIGIASGGVRVADKIFNEITHLAIDCRRPSSGRKDSHNRLMNLVAHLPVTIKNSLRIIESKILGLKKRRPTAVPPIEIGSAKRILIVDDAVDSGATLAGVIKALEADPEVTIRSAAITVTTSRPIVRPDFYIYNNHTLIRFPWSKDNMQP